jgi:hypothetical protein
MGHDVARRHGPPESPTFWQKTVPNHNKTNIKYGLLGYS